MKRARFLVITVAVMAGITFMATPAYAQTTGNEADDTTNQDQSQNQGGGINIWGACDTNGGTAVCAGSKTEATDVVKRIINLLLFVLGIAAVGLIIHSGLKYVTSRGDPANVKSAKDTLLYAVVGLIVASLSFVIVNFVVDAFNK